MWLDETDTTQLAQRLRLGPRETIESLGGPWQVTSRVPEREAEEPGTLFVGRAGPSVGILVREGADPEVVVGRAVGQWQGPATLEWSLVDPVVIDIPDRDAEPATVDEFLADLGAAVEEAFADARGSLVICRYCGTLLAPVHMAGDQMCWSCGSSIFGIVY